MKKSEEQVINLEWPYFFYLADEGHHNRIDL